VIAGFRGFISRGNVIDLAVAVVIGAAFGALVSSLVADLITPLIGAIIGEPDFSGLAFAINGSEFTYGNFINALIAFLSVAAAIYFFVVAPMEKLEEMRHGPRAAEKRPCPECLSEVPAPAKRCAFCTSVLPPADPAA
jgi:large conductance mechanosensitive channel